jgi:hypothetical protein
VRGLSQLHPAVLRVLAFLLVSCLSWGLYAATRTRLVLGGDLRFEPSVECRMSCAMSAERPLSKCVDDACAAIHLDQLRGCEAGCDAEHPRVMSALDFSYGWGALPDWPLVWASLVSNTELVQCFETTPGPVSLRMRVNAGGLLEKLGLASGNHRLDASPLDRCVRRALRAQLLPATHALYAYAVANFDLSHTDFAGARGALQQLLAKAARADDAGSSEQTTRALALLDEAELASTKRREEAERARREADAPPSDDYPTSWRSPWTPLPRMAPIQPVDRAWMQETTPRRRPEAAEAETWRDRAQREQHLRQVQRDVQDMRNQRIREERAHRERVQMENMQSEYLKTLKARSSPSAR